MWLDFNRLPKGPTIVTTSGESLPIEDYVRARDKIIGELDLAHYFVVVKRLAAHVIWVLIFYTRMPYC